MSDLSGNKRIARNSLFMSIRMVIVLCITLYTTRIVLANLGVEDYGIYNVVCGFVSMFAFLNTSIANGIQRFFNYELGKNGEIGANKVYNTALLIQFGLGVLIIFLTETIGLWYLYNKMVIPADRLFAAQWIFHFSVVSFLFVIIKAPYTAAVMAHEKMDFLAVISIIDAILKLLIAVSISIIPGDNLIVYGLLFILISVFDFLSYFIFCRRNFCEIRLNLSWNKELFHSMLSFSSWNMFGTLSGVIRDQGLNLIINLFYGPVVNAARGIATQINSGLQSFVQSITVPVRPQVVQSYAQGNMSRVFNLTYSISKLSCFFLTMMALPLCFEIDEILKIWLGDNIPNHATTFSVIVIMCSYQGNLNSAISGIVHSTGRMRNYQLGCSLVKLLSIPLAYIALKHGEAPEVALLMVFIFDWLGHLVGLFILKSLVEFSVFGYFVQVVWPITKVFAVSLIGVYILSCMQLPPLYDFLLVVIVGPILIAFVSYFLGLSVGEKNLVYSIMQQINKRLK